MRLGYIGLVVSLLALSSCVIPYSEKELANYGEVETFSSKDNPENLVMPQNRLKSLTITVNQNIDNLTNEKFKHCINMQFIERKVTLTDSRDNSYKYNYRQTPNSYSITKDYQVKPQNFAQTNATKTIFTNENSIKIFTRSIYKISFSERFMSYQFIAQNNKNERKYKFEQLRRGQLDSGNLPNLGADTRLVLTRGEDGITALNTLKNEVKQIEDCLSKN